MKYFGSFAGMVPEQTCPDETPSQTEQAVNASTASQSLQRPANVRSYVSRFAILLPPTERHDGPRTGSPDDATPIFPLPPRCPRVYDAPRGVSPRSPTPAPPPPPTTLGAHTPTEPGTEAVFIHSAQAAVAPTTSLQHRPRHV